MIISVIAILVIIVLALVIYNYSVHKKIETYSNLNQRITSLNVLQDFMKTLGETTSIKEKLENINDILISKYSIKYSTIVVFDGAEYVVKASNVDTKHWETLKNLQNDPGFPFRPGFVQNEAGSLHLSLFSHGFLQSQIPLL